MVATNNHELFTQLSELRNHGSKSEVINDPKPWDMAKFEVLGFNFRMSDIQAAVGVAQIQQLAMLITARRAAAQIYFELLSEIPEITLPIKLKLTMAILINHM